MRTADDKYFPMDADFSAIYEAAMEGREAIEHELLKGGKDYKCHNWTALVIDDRVWFKARVSEWGHRVNRECDQHTDPTRDCTPEEIRICVAKAIAELRKCTVEGRIAALEEEIDKLRNGEEGE